MQHHDGGAEGAGKLPLPIASGLPGRGPRSGGAATKRGRTALHACDATCLRSTQARNRVHKRWCVRARAPHPAIARAAGEGRQTGGGSIREIVGVLQYSARPQQQRAASALVGYSWVACGDDHGNHD